ncbi:unnamed protein product [Larinioides sclopetarius]|uniref:Uncharacterized protein n=1 Tax=Larinioides sclopetarius TaxID=280406 RepID=A0AAV2AZH2_9ARAC
MEECVAVEVTSAVPVDMSVSGWELITSVSTEHPSPDQACTLHRLLKSYQLCLRRT